MITNPEVDQALDYFLSHQPNHVHLVLSTRSDPSLSLARLRARGQMTEIRAQQLRFTPKEVQVFLERSLVLDQDTLEKLEQRTEGWPAGLQLAALALQNLSNQKKFVDSFRGSHRFVLDYLAEEVVRQQKDEVREFLTQTSILERFNAQLCSALTGYTNSQEMLEELDRENMFLVALDDGRVWYRYHHLFAEYLRTRLSNQEQAALYMKAAVWHQENELDFQAVKYAFKSGDMDFAAEIVGQALKRASTWSAGHIATLTSWLDELPEQVLASRPQLGLDASQVLYISGRLEQAEKLMDQAEQSLHSQPEDPHTQELLALANLYRGLIAAVRGQAQQAIDLIQVAQPQIPQENHLAQARAYYGLGQAHQHSGNTSKAIDFFLKARNESISAGILYAAVHASCIAAKGQITQGCLSLAEQTCRTAIDLADGEQMPILGLAWSILGYIALEQNNLEKAEPLLEEGIALSRQGNLRDDLAGGLTYLALLYIAQGKPEQALLAVEEAGTILRAFGISRIESLGQAYLARIHYHIGQDSAAEQWAEKYLKEREQQSNEFADLTLLRILLRKRELVLVQELLDSLLKNAQQAGRVQTEIEAMILQALYAHAKQELSAAEAWISQAVKLAAPEGFKRVFLDEGQQIRELLVQVREEAPKFVDRLLSKEETDAFYAHKSKLEGLPDPLTEQELVVLNLIVAGKTNQEIADELVISVGTTKWHVHNVYQKLDVSARPQAIARARELGL